MEIGNFKVINIVEKLVRDCLDEVLEIRPGMCRCDKCLADITAVALNKLNPRYVVSDKGGMLAKAAFLDKDMKITLLIAVAEAAEKISSNPRHDEEQKS
ncbi:MAG: late competence development ComFB family protein [Syntrophomonas sp.]